MHICLQQPESNQITNQLVPIHIRTGAGPPAKPGAPSSLLYTFCPQANASTILRHEPVTREQCAYLAFFRYYLDSRSAAKESTHHVQELLYPGHFRVAQIYWVSRKVGPELADLESFILNKCAQRVRAKIIEMATLPLVE